MPLVSVFQTPFVGLLVQPWIIPPPEAQVSLYGEDARPSDGEQSYSVLLDYF